MGRLCDAAEISRAENRANTPSFISAQPRRPKRQVLLSRSKEAEKRL